MPDYANTLTRVEDYFDRTATQTWERLTSDAPVSKVRETVRAGRDRMREVMLAQLPDDLTGHRVLDAGCGAGQMTIELAKRGAHVTAIDISPSMVEIAQKRLPRQFANQVTFQSGDMLCDTRGTFDHVLAMDSLIYYTRADLSSVLQSFQARAPQIVFTVAPRTAFLMAFWYAGKLFPRRDRSPVMVPQDTDRLARETGARPVTTVQRGFYISTCMEWRHG